MVSLVTEHELGSREMTIEGRAQRFRGSTRDSPSPSPSSQHLEDSAKSLCYPIEAKRGKRSGFWVLFPFLWRDVDVKRESFPDWVIVERDLLLPRWVFIALGVAFLLWRRPSTIWPEGLGTLGAAAVYNLLLARCLSRPEGLPPLLRYLTALLDTLLVTLYIASLRPIQVMDLTLYFTPLVAAALRFGLWGTLLTGLGTGVLGLLLLARHAVGGGLAGGWAELGVLLLAAGLLGYFSQHMRERQRQHLQRQAYLERRLSELAVLQQVSRRVHDLQSGSTLQNIVEICTRVLGFRRAALFLTGEYRDVKDGDGKNTQPGQLFSPQRTLAPDANAGEHASLPPLRLDRSLLAAVLQADRPFVVNDSRDSSQVQIAVPLHGTNGPVGALLLDCGEHPCAGEDELEMLEDLARSAVLAIENSRLHNRAQRMANLDGLTNLYNHRYFQERLRQMLAEAQEKGEPLSLVMVELDRFKKYNDTFGHRRGDLALRSVARALEACTRRWGGVAARYGGDEFMVILPGVDRERAAEAGHEIERWVVVLSEVELKRHNLPGVTVSVGVATYPDDATDAPSLIDAADAAMYTVKRSGGHGVYRYGDVHQDPKGFENL